MRVVMVCDDGAARGLRGSDADMQRYLDEHGWHFSRKLYDWAAGLMWRYGSDGERLMMRPLSDEVYQAILTSNEVALEHDAGWDGHYVMTMAMSDFMGSSLPTESEVARFVKDYVDDPDQPEGFILNRFCADCKLKGVVIDWSDMI